eukprot:5579235-Alexandrium_andersonii.AAC.1
MLAHTALTGPLATRTAEHAYRAMGVIFAATTRARVSNGIGMEAIMDRAPPALLHLSLRVVPSTRCVEVR